MESKQELRNKIESLEQEVANLKKERKEAEEKFQKELQEKINNAIVETNDAFYNNWKLSNEKFIKRFLEEERPYESVVKKMISNEISKIKIEEYSNYCECCGERGIKLTYHGDDLSSICTESY